MLRASSEIAVAISANSVLANPSSAPRSRPRCRALMMSTSARMAIHDEMLTSSHQGGGERRMKQREAVLEIERGERALQRQTELRHGERHLGLDPHDGR